MAFRRSGVRIPVAPPTPLNADNLTPRRERRGFSFIRADATVTTTGDTRDTSAGAPRPPRALRPERDRAALAGALGRAAACTRPTSTTLAAAVLPADDVPVPVGRPPHRPLVHQDADRRDRPLPPDARRQRVPADRLRRLRAAGRERRHQARHQPARMDDGRTSRTCAASCGRWARRSTGRPRSSPASPSTTAGTSGSSCSSSRPAWPTARCRRSTGAPTTGRWPASRSRAPTGAAGGAARRSRSASWTQWYLRITNYADELLDFTGIDWPEPIRIMQTNWIGRSEGARSCSRRRRRRTTPAASELRVFTTRPDTLFGATFMVLAPEHPLVATLTAPDRKAEVEAYVAAGRRADRDRPPVDRPREDRRADRRRRDQPGQRRAHPDLHRRLRAAAYGTGAIMAVPAHDERDFAFAEQFGLPIRQGRRRRRGDEDADAALDDGVRRAHPAERGACVNSGPFSGLPADEGGRRDRRRAGGAGKGEPRSPTGCATG